MNNIQIIKSPSGQPQYVVLTIEEYEKLAGKIESDITKVDIRAMPYDDDENEWQEIEYDADGTENKTIPHAVVAIVIKKRVSLVGAWRIYRGLTQDQVAEQLEISQANLSQIEKVGRVLQAKTKEKLAEIYGCTVEQLTD